MKKRVPTVPKKRPPKKRRREKIMPTYDYLCNRCGIYLERIVPIAERDEQFCQCTEAYKLERLEIFPTSPPILKATGFYQTDYKKS